MMHGNKTLDFYSDKNNELTVKGSGSIMYFPSKGL